MDESVNENEMTSNTNSNKLDSNDSTESNENDTESAKRFKTDDSGISVDVATSDPDQSEPKTDPEPVANVASTSFPKAVNSKSRNYRKNGRDSDDSSSSENENEVENLVTENVEMDTTNVEQELEQPTSTDGATSTETSGRRKNLWYTNYPQSNNSNTSSDELVADLDQESLSTIFHDSESEDESVDMDEPPVLSKEKPKHTWFMVQEVLKRQLGTSSKYNSSELFQRRCYGSLHCVQRLELMYKLEQHYGCVNNLNFHPNGSFLASGSDDLNVVVWDWPLGKALLSFDTKHKGNVFQNKFLPLTGDLHIATCARDGQVRLHQVSQTEGVRSSRRLGMHRGPAHKLTLLKDQPHVVLSAGEDGVVLSHDVRDNKPSKLLTVQSLDDRKIALYSISSHPLDTHQFCVSGRDHIVRIYDQRKITPVLNSFYPGHFKKKSDLVGLHVTCAIYNHNGTEILASYSDDDIYLFDTATTTNSYVHCYQGHRNGATIKGVNFFGPKSEYVVSGSDCGNLFFWDKNTESIVQWMLADDNGVVNCLEPHPQLPIICTSGLDWDVKVWVPSNEQEPEMMHLENTVRRNHRCRITERIHSSADINDSQMLWLLWRHLRTTERLQHRTRTTNATSGDSDPSNRNVEGDVTISDENSSSSNVDSSEPEDDDNDIVRPLTCSPS